VPVLAGKPLLKFFLSVKQRLGVNQSLVCLCRANLKKGKIKYMATSKENAEFAELILERYPLDTAIEYIAKNLNPSEVFGENELGQWALDNGFVKDPQ